MAQKFKNGDRVRCTVNVDGIDTAGRTGTVHDDSTFPEVCFDAPFNQGWGEERRSWGCPRSALEKIDEAPKTGFVKGARVRSVSDRAADIVVGGVYTLTVDCPGSSVLFHDGAGDHRTRRKCDYVLVNDEGAPASKTWIISLRADGVFKPAPEPKTYVSEAQAHAVAKEMAERYRGQTFVVFEATGYVNVPAVPVTELVRL